MPCSLPPEILDLVVDHLCGEPATLRVCCLVSKSWVPRSRRHLFAHVVFKQSFIESWLKVFPDPSNSPAHHTRTLWIRGLPALATLFRNAWVCVPFHHIVSLNVETFRSNDDEISLAPLRGLSPALKSLYITFSSMPLSEVFGLICSFPSLEDLILISDSDDHSTEEWSIPSSSPKFTGTLHLGMRHVIRSTVHRLLDLPFGLHFSEITVNCIHGDADSAARLVSRCSDTLKSLRVSFSPSSMFPSVPAPGRCLIVTRGHRHIQGASSA
jgi:hypothetical protein